MWDAGSAGCRMRSNLAFMRGRASFQDMHNTPSCVACMVRAASVARRGVEKLLAVPTLHPCEPGDRSCVSCVALELATEAVELLLECMTTLSNGALHERQRTEAIQPWSECKMPLSTEIDPVEAECKTASSAADIEPECELTVLDEAIRQSSKSKPTW